MIDIMHETEEGTSSETKGGVKAAIFAVMVCLVLAAIGGAYWVRMHNKPMAADPAASIAAVKAADTAWSKAAAAHNMEGVLSYYGDGAIVLPPNQEMATDKASIRKAWEAVLVKGTDVSWTPGAADISASGDLVYLEGWYISSTSAAKGKSSTERGKYLSVWKKQADGTWKCVADTWNSDMPAKK